MLDAESYCQISQTLARYMHACDEADADVVVELLCDAVVVGPSGTEVRGADAIRFLYSSLFVAPLDDGRRITKHHFANLRGDLHDATGAATTRCYYFVTRGTDRGIEAVTSGRLEHSWHRDQGTWRISRHVILRDAAILG